MKVHLQCLERLRFTVAAIKNTKKNTPYGNHGYYIPLSRNIFPLKIEKTLGLQKRATCNRTHPKKKKRKKKRKKRKRKEKVKKFTVKLYSQEDNIQDYM